MKITKSLKRVTSLTAVIVLMLGVIPFTAAVNVTTVYADDEVITEPVESPAEEAAVEEAAGEPVETPAEEAATEEAVEEPVESPAEEAPVEEVAEETVETSEESALADPEPVEPEAGEDLSELVEVLNKAEAQIADENGEALPLASKEAAQVLVNGDPFFWAGDVDGWVGYTESGTGCPVNVTCKSSTLLGMGPFEAAVAHATLAEEGKMIYVAGGDYTDENIVVDYEGLSFTAFHTITVPAAHTAPTYTSGYAWLNSITLNVNIGTTEGVYADEVIVNEFGTSHTGGRLEDGLALVNDGGTVEADVVLKSGGGYFIFQDANDSSGTEYEFECGEPDVHIYQKGWNGSTGEYRMVFKRPTHLDIVDYYQNHSPDERSDIPLYLTGTPLDAELRLEDLVIGVNVSDRDGWGHTSERLIYWNLLGNTGIDANGQSMNLNTDQQDKANSITDGTNDTIKRDHEIWFLWPIFEYHSYYSSNIKVNAYETTTEDGQIIPARQLTFIQLPTSDVRGCTDPESENYDPNANNKDNKQCEYCHGCMDPNALNYNPDAVRSDGSCIYKSTVTTAPPAGGPPAPLMIPVTGLTDQEFIIPVTGMDLTNANETGLLGVILLVSVMALGASLILLKKNKQKEH